MRTEQAEALKARVCELLNWTEERYAQFVWDCGQDYLNAYLRGDKYAIGMLEYSRVFWAWWKSHWAKRDENFLLLNKHNPLNNVQTLEQLYAHYNDGWQLAESIHPNSVVLNESYALMMKELIAEEVKANQNVNA